MNVLSRLKLNVKASIIKLVRVKTDIPDENSFNDDLTWHNFESSIRITKKTNFKWYENCYGDKPYGMSHNLKNTIKKKLLKTGKPKVYREGKDWYTVEKYSLAEVEPEIGMSPIIAVVECGGNSGYTGSWNNEFIIVRKEDISLLQEILNS